MNINTETPVVVGAAHPLDPLSRAEISQTVSILKDGPAAAETFSFISVELREPDKEALRSGSKTAREAEAVLIDQGTKTTYEATVNLDSGILTEWTQLGADQNTPERGSA